MNAALLIDSVSSVCANRRVHLMQHAPWITEFMDEMCSFPSSTNDDQTDSFVGGLMRLVHGGFVNIGAQLKQQQKEEELKKNEGQMTGASKRLELFGKDGTGKKSRGSFLRRSPV